MNLDRFSRSVPRWHEEEHDADAYNDKLAEEQRLKEEDETPDTDPKSGSV